MGYYSDYNGSYKPKMELTREQSDKILAWFMGRFGYYECDGGDINFGPFVGDDGNTKWYMGDVYFVPSSGEVVPAKCNMKGYHFNFHLYEFVRMLNSIGVEYEGSVERQGEAFGDMEDIRIEGGKVVSYRGRIIYGNPTEVTITEKEYESQLDGMLRSRFGLIG